jgi:hypothetical protein
MKRQAMWMAAIVALTAGSALAGDMGPRSSTGSKDFERMKTLAGVWTGTGTMEPTGQPVRVEYRVTAAGSAVVETLFPGTPHEMVSVYYDKAGTLNMTHYCALGNRPHMVMKNGTADMIEMELAPHGEIAADREPHMHALKITFEGADKIVAEWTAFDAGKKTSVSTFALSRVK